MIIALTGPSRSGKDTAARYLREAWTATPKGDPRYALACTMALADPIRAAADALGVPRDLVRERKDEPHSTFDGGTGRDLLLELGRATRGWCGDDHFARLGVERARDAESLCEGRLVIVTDVRREVEARLLVRVGARLLLVDRGVDPATDALFGSEWPKIRDLKPATLSNRSGLAELTIACRAVVDALRAEVWS